ncbi:hypothetical protein [Isoptericola variabilis]|uniref:Uncharacterized protein n=1 Tax=Isoptericola variabilis (strain 225) TaxID=743718 RepID=F6FW59_ISOV2|nr:hypothetical protein [Isoptericola variabilis]AEG45603.1 hypothetical protein Isova_2918 [Isoptericola variabilis 225]TWH25789.1 hypothetical protein L600_000900000390 [Isoptericola variabilis J7]
MTAATTAPRTTERTTAEVRPISFATLALVEWRKQLDTRAGRWLLATIGIITAAVVVITGAVGDGNVPFGGFFLGTVTPMAMLLPIVGILAATSEWSQRTALVTFTLEPRRVRVGLAKLLSAVASGVVFFAAAFGVAALAHLWVVQFRGAEASWNVPGDAVLGALLLVVIGMVQGVGFGLLLLNTPAAIVSYLFLPTLFSIVGSLITAVRDAMPWIDLGTAGAPILEGGASGQEWAQVATATLIWAVLPVVGGLVRLTRSEIKSA